MSTDYDCWHATEEDVTVAVVMATMKSNAENARRFVGAVLDELSKEEHAEQILAKHLEGGSKIGASTAVEGRSKESLEKLHFLFPGYW
jgi:5'-methylthioadenosine phosphorylase